LVDRRSHVGASFIVACLHSVVGAAGRRRQKARTAMSLTPRVRQDQASFVVRAQLEIVDPAVRRGRSVSDGVWQACGLVLAAAAGRLMLQL
jgi:hypothetical protein